MVCGNKKRKETKKRKVDATHTVGIWDKGLTRPGLRLDPAPWFISRVRALFFWDILRSALCNT
jgi:hypothetical protein